MTRVVQAECPHCKKLLRIPAEWIAQQMKCKHCRQVFQARPLSEPVPRLPNPSTHSVTITASTPPPTPFEHLTVSIGQSDNILRSRSRRRQAGTWKALLLLAAFVAVAGAVFVSAGPHWSDLFSAKDSARDANGGDKKQTGINDPAKKKGPKLTPSAGNEVFPRRALLINVSNYLLFNPLHYGNPRDPQYPGSSTSVLADTLSRPPLNIPATQITELADGSRSPFPTSKAVIENTLTEFAATSRPQDRIIVLFTGHALDKDKDAYLVPIDGDRDDVKTLIPLTLVYERLSKCKARQKLLILDVFRYPPARGEELPGTDEMTEDFSAKAAAPPAGVQVWTSCVKDQKSIELEGGSVFMQALCTVLQERLPGIQEPSMPLPLDVMVPKVNERLKEILAPQKIEQVSKLTGTHLEQVSLAYDAAEPLPPKLVIKAPKAAADNQKVLAIVTGIVDELNHLPPVRAQQKPRSVASLPAFTAEALADYAPDYKNWNELVEMAEDKSKYPLRAAVLRAIQATQESEKLEMRESLTNPGGPITPQVKSQFAANQKDPGMLIFELEKALNEVKEAGAKRNEETSKRWLAHYDYAQARLQERLVYLYEYDNILAQVRRDDMPALEPIHNGWRVGSERKVQIKEPKVREMVKDIGKTWKRIARENPGTPWAVLAKRESLTALGLVWRPSRD